MKPSTEKNGSSSVRDERTMLVAVTKLARLAPTIAGGLGASVFVGYFIGWRTAVEYFAGFGAAWVVSLLSPLELLQWSYSPLLAVFFGIFLALVSPVSRASNDDAVFRAEVGAGALGFLLFAVALVGGEKLGSRLAAQAGLLSSLFLAADLGFTLVRWALERRTKRLTWSKRQLWFAYSIWTVGCLMLPIAAGRAQGKLAADVAWSQLPVVTVGSEEWRLLIAHGDQLVVAQLNVTGRPIVKIVNSGDALAIRAKE